MAENIGFILAPRLNAVAVGARPVGRALVTDDAAKADMVAEQPNAEMLCQEISRKIFIEVEAMHAGADRNGDRAAKEGWHAGDRYRGSAGG
ncbi:MAG: hypothetical protein ACLR2G_10435 [Phascolarctobacterium faecium]